MFEVKVQKNFSAAHHLLNYNGECEKQHGHNWKVEVYARGNELNASNILMDFKDLKAKLKTVIDEFDHEDINELEIFKNVSPSSEMIAKVIFEKLKKDIPQIHKVTVWETEDNCASYFEE